MNCVKLLTYIIECRNKHNRNIWIYSLNIIKMFALKVCQIFSIHEIGGEVGGG